MPRPKQQFESTRRYIPDALWPEFAKMIEEYKQQLKEVK